MSNRREQTPKERKTIGKKTKQRGTWEVDPRTKVVAPKKGKKSPYKRNNKIRRDDY